MVSITSGIVHFYFPLFVHLNSIIYNSKSRRISGEEKEAVKAEISDISGRLKVIRKEVRLCEGISARSDTLKEKLQTIRADENEQRRKELMKNEHRRRSGRTNRPNELGGL